jgi:hypothetical protein
MQSPGRPCPDISTRLSALEQGPARACRRVQKRGRPRPGDCGSLEIGGRARPENIMSRIGAVTKAERARQVIDNLGKVFPPGAQVVLGGKAYLDDEVIAIFRAHLAAIDAKKKRYAEYQQAVAAEQALAKQTADLWQSLTNVVRVRLPATKLPVMGIKARKKPGPKTVAAKAAGVEKRAKKRRSG